MLHRLVIKNYALIDNLDINFSNKLNILTGETGAGKSIILGALSLILGQRTETKYFYNQQKKCIIEGFFRIPDYDLTPFFEENDLDYDLETVLRREISADGKSRAFINDTPVNLTILKQLGERLIDIHSQHATLEINDENFQLMVVDALAGHDLLLNQYKEIFKDYNRKKSNLKELAIQNEKFKTDLDYYQFQFDELDKAELKDQEQEKLEQESETLSHAEEIKKSLLTATSILTETETSVLPQLKECINQVQAVEKFNFEVSKLTERIKSTLIELKDVTAEIETLEQSTIFNDARLDEINRRLDVIYSLQKKHRVNTIGELIAIRQSFSERLLAAGSSEEDIRQLEQEVKSLKGELIVLSDTISASRNEIIPEIEKKVASLLAEAGMPSAVLKIENRLLEEDELNTKGRNSIKFFFSANKGLEPAPMNKIASGGELSRLMLAIKSLIAKHTSLPSIIFDEIDTGISGEVAIRVGNLIERLSENMQVIAITHLPQIASKGKAHYRVFKDEKDNKTFSNITVLSEEERIIEIAKMLSGENPGESAYLHARELLFT